MWDVAGRVRGVRLLCLRLRRIGMSEKIKVGGLWKNKTQDGKSTYISGALTDEYLVTLIAHLEEIRESGNGVRLLIFGNSYKTPEKEKEPDYILYIAPNQLREETGGGRGGGYGRR